MRDLFPFYSISDFINQPHKHTEFEVTLFEEMEEPNVEDPHKHTFYEILWVDEGSTEQTIDYKEYQILPGMLFFISPGQLHNFEDWQNLSGGSILFTEDFFLMNQQNKDRLFELVFLDNVYFNPSLKLDNSTYSEVKDTIAMICKEHRRKDSSILIIQSLLQVLLVQISRNIEKQKGLSIPKQYIITYKKFKTLVDLHYADGYTPATFADQLHITPHHLNHVCKMVTGKTSTQILRERTILEAKRLLSFSGETISEISAHLGFFDSSYFAKVFKAETGVSAVEFRHGKSPKPTE